MESIIAAVIGAIGAIVAAIIAARAGRSSKRQPDRPYQPGKLSPRRHQIRRGTFILAIATLFALSGVIWQRIGDGCHAVREEFESSELDPQWDETNLGQFTVANGAMAITAIDGADVRSDLQGDITAPFLRRMVNGEFSIDTTVIADVSHSYQGAGILIYGDNSNYVRLEHGYGSFGAIVFEYAAEGEHIKVHGPFEGDNAPIRTSASIVQLRLTRTGTTVKASWRPSSSHNWEDLSGSAHLSGNVEAGVAVLNRFQAPAGDPEKKPLTAVFPYVNIDCP